MFCTALLLPWGFETEKGLWYSGEMNVLSVAKKQTAKAAELHQDELQNTLGCRIYIILPKHGTVVHKLFQNAIRINLSFFQFLFMVLLADFYTYLV